QLALSVFTNIGVTHVPEHVSPMSSVRTARRGGCAKKKILRSNLCRHRRGGRSNSNKSFERPPRPLLVDASRHSLMSRPPLLSRRGNFSTSNFKRTHYQQITRRGFQSMGERWFPFAILSVLLTASCSGG